MKLYVGNLSFQTTEDGLREHFARHGSVTNATLMIDRMSGRSRGFGFVTMETDADGQAAIRATHGKPLDGRTLTVNEARPREDRPARAFSGSRR